LGRRYVQYANRFDRRTGSRWEGRHKSSVAQAGDDPLACPRNIELNPVRAGMGVDPRQDPRFSDRANDTALNPATRKEIKFL